MLDKNSRSLNSIEMNLEEQLLSIARIMEKSDIRTRKVALSRPDRQTTPSDQGTESLWPLSFTAALRRWSMMVICREWNDRIIMMETRLEINIMVPALIRIDHTQTKQQNHLESVLSMINVHGFSSFSKYALSSSRHEKST